uniref:Uncharacterized protein n=1 Tax=Panagrolaimus superbus TaxID=310955 RepID=A0A914YTQ0_9BILA
MPGLSKHRKKAKVEALKREEAKRAARSDTRAENEDLNTTELAEVIAKTKVKLGRKRLQKQEPDFVVTRQIAAVLEAKEKVKEQGRNRTQNFRAKVAENLEASKEKAKKRRGILEQTKTNIKVKKLEERNEELEEMIAAKNTNFSQPSSSSYQRLSIDTEDSLALTSAPLSPTEVMSFNFRTPESASPFLDVHEK